MPTTADARIRQLIGDLVVQTQIAGERIEKLEEENRDLKAQLAQYEQSKGNGKGKSEARAAM